MPKYKAIVTLGDGGRHVVYQEAINGYEANQILSTMYQQDVQAMVIFDDPNIQVDKMPARRSRSNATFVNPIDEAKNMGREVLVTVWNDLVRKVIAGSALCIILIIIIAVTNH
jgi:hypothetical protein